LRRNSVNVPPRTPKPYTPNPLPGLATASTWRMVSPRETLISTGIVFVCGRPTDG